MEPAKNIIARLGGPAQVADALGIHRTRPYCWMKSRERGGTGGLIPQEHFQRLIEIGAEMGVVLTGDDFVPTTSVRKASA